MCLIDAEKLGQEMGNMENNNINTNNNNKQCPLQREILPNQTENLDKETPLMSSSLQKTMLNSFQLESICEDTVVVDRKQSLLNFSLPFGQESGLILGGRTHMEDAHICVGDLAKKFGYNVLSEQAISFFGVFDGHGGKDAAQFVCDNLPRVVVEDADFPLELEKVITRSFMETDAAFAKTCSLESSLASGTTALTAMICGRSLLVANAGDCWAVLS